MQIGEILRAAREEKQLSLEDIQEITKIQKRYLAAIETDDYQLLPGKFYARAFIREFALAVNIDPLELLEEFDESEVFANETESVQYTRLSRSRRSDNMRGSSILSYLPTLIVIILIIGILFVGWSLYQKTLINNDDQKQHLGDDQIIRDKSTPPVDDDVTADDTDNAEDQSEDKANEGEFSVVEAGSGTSPTSTVDFTYATDHAEVEFVVTAKTYIAIKDEDNVTLHDAIVEAGQEPKAIDVTGKERIFFNIGYSPGAKIIINGVELPYPVDVDKSVHQKIWVNLKKSE